MDDSNNINGYLAENDEEMEESRPASPNMLGNLYLWPGQYYAQSLSDFLRPHGMLPTNTFHGLLGPFDIIPTREMLPRGGGFYFIMQKMELVQAIPYRAIFTMIDSIVMES